MPRTALGGQGRQSKQLAAYAACVPASGIPVAAALARVTERRSSGSMLCSRALPAPRAIIDASPALALRMLCSYSDRRKAHDTGTPVSDDHHLSADSRAPIAISLAPTSKRLRAPFQQIYHSIDNVFIVNGPMTYHPPFSIAFTFKYNNLFRIPTN